MSELRSIQFEGTMLFLFDGGDNCAEEKETEETILPDDMSVGTFKQFLQMLFNESQVSEGAQEKIMQMTVAEFCDLYDSVTKTHQGDENPIPPGVPKMKFLSNLTFYSCPICKEKSTFGIVDGYLECEACGHNFGDVDQLCERLFV